MFYFRKTQTEEEEKSEAVRIASGKADADMDSRLMRGNVQMAGKFQSFGRIRRGRIKRAAGLLERILLVGLLVILTFGMAPAGAWASASAETLPPNQAETPPDLGKKCSLSVMSSVSGTYKVWKVADMIDQGDGSVVFQLDRRISDRGVQVDLMDLSGSASLKPAVTLDNLLSTLSDSEYPPVVAGIHLKSGTDAQVIGTGLEAGLYLLDCRADQGTDMEMNPVLVSIPNIEDHQWDYDVTIDATKFSEKIDKSHFQIKKVWKDKESKDRPKSVKIQIQNKKTGDIQTVTLSADNEWSYSWEADADMAGSDWAISELDEAKGYQWTVDYDGEGEFGLFTVTNVGGETRGESESESVSETSTDTEDHTTEGGGGGSHPHGPDSQPGGGSQVKTGDQTPVEVVALTACLSAIGLCICAIILGARKKHGDGRK